MKRAVAGWWVMVVVSLLEGRRWEIPENFTLHLIPTTTGTTAHPGPQGRSVCREHGLSVHTFYYFKLLNNINVSLGKKEWTTCSSIEEDFFSAWAICSWFIYVSFHPNSHYWGSLAFGGYPLGLDLKQTQLSFCFCMTHFQSIETLSQTLAVQLCST